MSELTPICLSVSLASRADMPFFRTSHDWSAWMLSVHLGEKRAGKWRRRERERERGRG
jgi:hypothetical protein